MPPQRSLRGFLKSARAALAAPPEERPRPLYFVVGNESADLDSLCSTLFLAYFRSHMPPYVPHVPLLHLHRKDLTLHPEFRSVLMRAGGKMVLKGGDDLVTMSELPGTLGVGALKPEDTRWVLVDHNVMTGHLVKRFGDKVVGCVDHHDDEGVVPRDAELRVIEKAGSCMSLVVEQCRETWEALAKGDEVVVDREGQLVGEDGEVVVEVEVEKDAAKKMEINAQLAYLALAPILVDTANLGNKDKTTAHDERAAEIVEGYIRTDIRTKYFTEISSQKEDVSLMSIDDILRKDYKEWLEGRLKLGTSSAPQPFTFLVSQAGGIGKLTESLRGCMKRNHLDVMVVLTTSKNNKGEFVRELLVFVRSLPNVVTAVKEFMEGEGKEKLGLQTYEEGRLDGQDEQGTWKRCWRQERVEFSRKQIAPMLRDVLKKAL
ncbi:DHH phosphoesterase [Annulohypoxylon moriforme]|nr:DHH phosphoesterase [Annulohypoxylon moriforme]